MSGLPSDAREYEARPPEPKGARDVARRIGDVWQRLGTNGAPGGTSGTGWRTFLTSAAIIATVVAAINVLDVITIRHEEPQYGLAGPIVWEGTSWLTLLASLWIPWLAFRLAPPLGRPWWRVPAVHPIAAVLFAVAHVGGFVFLRKLIYWLGGGEYDFGALGAGFAYELSKDAFGYLMIIAGFTLNEYVINLLAQRPAMAEPMYTIRDGARIIRVPVRDILAVSSAGNYVEFCLRDGRKPLMRSPLGAVEVELASHGFVRVHRSWLVNAMQMTGLKPEGSGDYTVELGTLSVPLSRRFPEALAKLRAG
jgi:hypothetical protein